MKLKGLILLAGLALGLGGCGNSADFKVQSSNENFGQRVVYNTKVDVLWVMDNSSSMGQHQANLGSQSGVFIDYLVQSKFDFRLAVTTTDVGASGEKGAFVGTVKVLDRNTPNLKAQFASNINVGQTGSDLERGLSAMQMALSSNMLNTVNAGFFRPDAMLAVIVMSDEEDSSAGSTQDFINYLDQLKPPFEGGSRGWILNSIVVPQIDGTCRTFNQFASAGYRYMTLSQASTGSVESICTADFSNSLKNLRARIVERLTEYHLKTKPIIASIRVRINGVDLPQDPINGWTYEAQGLTIKFHGNGVPPADANVQITYQPDLS